MFTVFLALPVFGLQRAAGKDEKDGYSFSHIFSSDFDAGVVASNVPAVVCLGIFGGFVREINQRDCNVRRLLAGMTTSAFVSIFMAMLVAEMPMNSSFRAAAIIGAGYSGRPILDKINKTVQRKIDRHLSESPYRRDKK